MNLTIYQSAPAPSSLTAEQLEQALDAALALESYIKSLRKEALKRLASGSDVPGWCLVSPEKKTTIMDAAAAQKALMPLMMPEEFMACCRPSIEKLIKTIKDREGCTEAEAKDILGEYLKGNLVKPAAEPDEFKLERKLKQVELISK